MRVLMVSKALTVAAYRAKLRELANLGVDLTVVVPTSWRESGHTIICEPGDDEGYSLRREPIRWNGHFHLHYYPTLPRIMREVQPEIVHIDEEPYNLATYLALRSACTVGGRSLFFTWQNILRHYPPPFNFIERAVYRHATHAIAGSQEAATVLRRKGYHGRIAVIPQFGVDPEQFSPGLTSTERPFTVGFLGRLVPEKGISDLLAAFSRLDPTARLIIAGDGPQRADIESSISQMDLEGRVELRQRLPSREVPDLLRQLDVVVLPSHTTARWKEQFGRVLIEAMACGVPVVGSRSGEIPHVIGDAGIVFPEGDIEALAMALARLQADERLRLDLARRGRERVLAHYTQQRIAEQTYDLYRQMLHTLTS
jgi:glycosyltransferase involved in cell wall biosynthesis